MTFDEILAVSPFSLDKGEKGKLMTERLTELTMLHSENCLEYKRILDAIGFEKSKVESYTDLPFLPVRLFKELELRSVP